MPQYLSTTQPETLLLLRRLDGYGASKRNAHHSQHQQPNGRQEDGDERRRWRHRSPNTSLQSLRFDEAQRRVKIVEEFKQAQLAFGRVLPIRCWTGQLQIPRFYRDDYTTSRSTFSWKATDTGTTDDDDDALSTRSTCSNNSSSLQPLQTKPGQTSSVNGHSRSKQPLKPLPRKLVARRPKGDVNGCQSLTSAAAATGGDVAKTEDDDDDVLCIDCRIQGIIHSKPSPPPQDNLKGK